MKVCFTIIFLFLLFVSPARATDTIPAAYIPSSEDTTIYHTPDTTFDSTALELNTYKHNPLFIDLIYMGKSIDIAREKPNYQELYFGEKAYSLSEPVEMLTVEEPLSALWSLRSGARDYIARQNILLYTTTIEELPIVTWNRNEILGSLRDELFLKVNEPTFNISGISLIKGNKINPWTSRLHTSLQFSQNAVSKNWHKGGYNNLSVLGILTGHLNYDNYKKVRWENFLEWRSGLTALDVIPDSTWIITPNEDLFRIISNFGLKATGNFYYSSKADFQTQFFNSPKALNSTELKARFLTPIKFTLGVGMKYQRKALTIELSPVTFR